MVFFFFFFFQIRTQFGLYFGKDSRNLSVPKLDFMFFYNIISYCGPRISAHALTLDDELIFYFENNLLIKKMTWSRHLFLFYF